MEKDRENNNYRYDKNGWIYVHLKGDARTIGKWHGKLMAKEIENLIKHYQALLPIQTGMDWSFFREKAVELWDTEMGNSKFLEYKEELEGMVEGIKEQYPASSVTYEDLLTWNGYEELTDYWFPAKAKEIYDSLPSENKVYTYKDFHIGVQDHCSAFLATGSYTEDGKIVVAHNSFVPFEIAAYMNVILDIEPENGEHFIMQSQPGLLHSLTDFYENKAGIVITETTIGGFTAYAPEDGIPEFLRIRRAAQYSTSLDEFKKEMLDGNNGGYACTWLVGDINTNEIMNLELGAKFHKDDRTKDGVFVGFNAPLDPRIRNFECSNTGFTDIRRHQGARQVRLPQLMEQYKGQMNNEIAQTILQDHFDIYLNKENPCSRTICSHYELDERAYMSQPGRPVPFRPQGAIDGITATSEDIKKMQMWGRFGSSCGMPFKAKKFFQEHPQFDYLSPFIFDRPSQPWTKFPEKKTTDRN